MAITAKDVELGIEFSKRMEITAVMDENKSGVVKFIRTDPPAELSQEVREILDFCAEYFERMVFMGGLDEDGEEQEQETNGFDNSEDILKDINIRLKEYKEEFIIEVEKNLKVENHPSLTPFAQVMLHHKNKSK